MFKEHLCKRAAALLMLYIFMSLYLKQPPIDNAKQLIDTKLYEPNKLAPYCGLSPLKSLLIA
jgi:hypothetical protein